MVSDPFVLGELYDFMKVELYVTWINHEIPVHFLIPVKTKSNW